MPRVSVVVPIYNVERYLTDCLESLAHQTLDDLEVVMVDDGSTDSSARIAADFAARDNRFVLVQQPNGGLGHARNTGAEKATGDYLAFVDSDDVVVQHAYESLADSLDRTGSDFATGNFHRLTAAGTKQAGMVSTVFHASRPATHIRKHVALLNDRTAWNKLFRRTFWDEHGFRWPEGVLYEDIPVTLPAHVLAKSVDVLREPIYLWRARVGDSSSITQRRTELRAIRDRFNAVDGVSRFLAQHGEDELKVRYDASVAEQDLHYFLMELDEASDEFRALFLDLVNDFFDRARPDVFDDLPAIHRLKWHLVRRRLMPELLEVLRFEKSGEIQSTPVVRRGRRLWGDYPFRGDAGLAIPDEVYRLGKDELPLRARIEDIWWDGDVLRLEGYAYISFLDLSNPRSSRIRLTLEESGHAERVASMKVEQVRRPDVTRLSYDGVTNYEWAGFRAALPARELQHRGRFRNGSWRLRVEVRSHGITRRRWIYGTEPGRAKRPDSLLVDGARITPTTPAGNFSVQVATSPAEVEQVRLDGDVLELVGNLYGRAFDPATAHVRAFRSDGTSVLHLPVATAGSPGDRATPFVSRIDLALLASQSDVIDEVAHTQDMGDGIVWELFLLPTGPGSRLPLSAGAALDEPRLRLEDSEVLLRRTRVDRLEVVERHLRPEVEEARLDAGGVVTLTGRYSEPTGRDTELVLRADLRAAERVVPVRRDGDRFTARVDTSAVPTVGGELPLGEGLWDFYARPTDRSAPLVRVVLDRPVVARMPQTCAVGARQVRLVDVDQGALQLEVSGDLPVDQRGLAGGRRLQEVDHRRALGAPLLQQVLVDAYAQGAFGGDAAAVVTELRRSHPELPLLWAVDDGQAVLPDEVLPVARPGRDWYEAMARSAYVVLTDRSRVVDLPRRPDQTVLQLWHASPVRAVGLDDERAGTRLGRGWEDRLRRDAAGWDMLVSASPAETTRLRHAFDYGGTVVETGRPAHDALATDRPDRADDVRRRLGIAAGRAVVLYAPTYRPDVMTPAGGYGLDLGFDLDDLRPALGGAVLVVRPHPKVADEVLAADGSDVVDASLVPDVADLLLVADVLVTDRSALLVDFALTGKPVVVLDGGDQRRPSYVGQGEVPGVLVSAPGELGPAIASALAGDPEDTATRRKAFIDGWAPHADGGASARVVAALLDAAGNR